LYEVGCVAKAASLKPQQLGRLESAMKRLTLTLALAWLFAAGVASAQNLLVNGSFDGLVLQEPNPPGTSIPDGWRRYTFGGSDATYVVNDPGGNAVDGPNYLQIGAFNALVQVTTATITANTTYNLAAFGRSFGAGPYDVRVYAMADPLEVIYYQGESARLATLQFPLNTNAMTELTTQFTPAAQFVGQYMGVYIAAHANFYGFDNVRLTAAAAPTLDADFDNNGKVDGADFLTWQRGLGLTGASATNAAGNADGDADVDKDDLAIWKAHFGLASANPAAAGVPEPAAWALFCMCSTAIGAIRRSRCGRQL
jgi:hypothetical protein